MLAASCKGDSIALLKLLLGYNTVIDLVDKNCTTFDYAVNADNNLAQKYLKSLGGQASVIHDDHQ
jgi:hypothetical protein